MNVGFSVWDNRIAPVFDVARLVHIVQSRAGRIVSEREETLANGGPTQKALRLVELDIDTLVCGAISRQLLKAISAYGVCVIPFVAGDLQEVIRAHLAGTIQQDEYAMPGCGHRRGRSDLPQRYGSSGTPRAGQRR